MKRTVLNSRTKYTIVLCTLIVACLIFISCFVSMKQKQELLFLQTTDKLQQIMNTFIPQVMDKVCKLKASLFSVTIEKNDNSVVGENHKIIAEIYYEQPIVVGNSDAVKKINEYFETEAEGWIHGEVSRLTFSEDGWWEWFLGQFDDMREMYGDDVLAVQPCHYTVKTEFKYQNEQYICFKHMVTYQTGGPSSDYCFGTTFDKNTGEIVPLNEIVEIDGNSLKEIFVASYKQQKIHKTRKEEYEELIEMLYGNNTVNDFILSKGKDEIRLNYEYYYDGEFFHLILNGEITYNNWWEVGWNGKTGSDMIIFPSYE